MAIWSWKKGAPAASKEGTSSGPKSHKLRWVVIAIAVLLVALAAILGGVLGSRARAGGSNGGATPAGGSPPSSRPNIIFILTDDQDQKLNSLDYMNGVKYHLIDQGASYEHHFCTVALCCPSRVNLWTGRAAHNTNVTDISPPYGGYPKFIQQGLNDDWLPIWMQNAGYNTYYVGKLMNSYSEDNYNKPFPNGFNGSDFLCGKGTYNYYNPIYQRNQDPPMQYKNNYTTDLLWNKSLGFLDDARQAGGPFFLTMATVAPHEGNGPRPDGTPKFGPVPKAEYANLFNNVTVARTANFNPDKPSGTSWLLDISQLNQSQVDQQDEFHRQRLRALQSVDEIVNNTMAYLEQYDLLNNTYIIYSSDNGFHISQHRLYPGKNLPYEEDISVPLIIRGPGITPGSNVSVATSHTDLAPTILHIANASLPDYLDGSPLPLIDAEPVMQNFEHAQIEHWGGAGGDDLTNRYPNAPGTSNSTYKALRLIGAGYDYYYSVWCSNQHELYDMSTDAGQMDNLYANYSFQPNEAANNNNNNQSVAVAFPLNRLTSRLEALLLVLKSCKAASCIRPWQALQPDGAVQSLLDAMDPAYDVFYEQSQPRISFDRCEPGYIVDAEGPQTWVQYTGSSQSQSRMAFALDRLF